MSKIFREEDVKTKTDLIKFLRTVAGASNQDFAEHLNMPVTYFTNKIYRGSFSIDDLATICASNDWKLIIESNYDGRVIFDVTKLLSNKEAIEKAKRKTFDEYIQTKSKLKEMEKMYPFLKKRGANK